MLRSPLRILFLMVALILLVEPLRSVQGIILSQVERATISSLDSPLASSPEKRESRGNGFARALKAPFKAIARLFGRKKDNNKLEPISEKDIKRFEGQVSNTAPVTQVTSIRSTSSGASAQDHLESGRALLNAGKLDEAIAELSASLSIDAKLSEASTLLGVAYERRGQVARARDAFETALHTPDDEAMHLNNLGYLQYKYGEYEEAIKYLKRATKLAPNDPRIWNNLGLAQSELGKFKDAYKSFARAAGEFNGHLNVAMRLENQGFPEEAIKHLEKALALQPNSPIVLTRLVGLYERTGRPERAEQARNALKASAAANALAEKK